MDQIVDLEKDALFQNMNVELISLAVDSVTVLGAAGAEWGVTTPLLSDGDKSVSEAYGVMRWATPGGEPSHTFVLLDADGTVLWIQDYGHPDNGGRMYVPLSELVSMVAASLSTP